jgi:hypothetical protein
MVTATMELPRLDSADLESRVKEKRRSMIEKSLSQTAPSTSEASGANFSALLVLLASIL